MSTVVAVPARPGPRPRTTSPGIPHHQLDQQPTNGAVGDGLAARLFGLPGVEERPSGISVPGARALWLAADAARGPREAFFVDREFAHLHPAPDVSLHVTLPTPEAEAVIAAGWGEWHPYVQSGLLPRTVVMLYAPRDAAEAGIVEQLVRRSWQFARGVVA